MNDLRGHASGDLLLRSFAAALTQHVSEQVFRMGGDEYVVLCADSRLEHLPGLIRDAVHKTQRLGFPEIDASSGLAWRQEVRKPAALLSLADQRMYREQHAKPPYRSAVPLAGNHGGNFTRKRELPHE